MPTTTALHCGKTESEFVQRLCEQALEIVQLKEQVKSLKKEDAPEFCRDSYETVMNGGASEFIY